MRYEDASHSGAFAQGADTVARDDTDALAAGSKAPATGNLITGEGTQTGPSGADNAAGAHITAIAGAGGEDTSFAGGKLQVAGEFGRLTVDAEGNYSYATKPGTPENSRDRFTYTLADNQGSSDTAVLTIEIGKTPAVIKANAQQVVVGPDGVVVLPAGVELSDVRIVGRNLVVDLPDGGQMVIIDGAVFVPQLVLGGVEVPATNLAALLIGQEPQPAAGGPPPSSGGNFEVPVNPLDPGVPLGDLIPPTEMVYTPPEVEEIFDILDRDPEITIDPGNGIPVENAVDSVNEAGLPTRPGEPEGSGEEAAAGANGDTSEATTGTIIINSPDTPNTITINGIEVTSVGQVIPGDFGTLTITSISAGAIGYLYTLTDNTSGNNTHDDFSVTVEDSDGDTDTATLVINIVDDVPTARPDTDAIASGEYGPVTGNVITDADAGDAGDSDNGRDTVGADDADLTAVTGAGATTSIEGGFQVQGAYGVLTILADGSYSYTRDPGTPGGVSDVFNYTLTDGDGDTSSTTLTISIGDATPETDENPGVLLDDDTQPNGNPGGVGDDPDAANLTGTLAGSGGDGPLTFDLLTTGAPAGFTYVNGPDGSILVQQGGTTVLTITIDAETGDYTVTQNAAIDHPAGGNENNLSFTINYNVVDQDGDTAGGTLNINVDDDTPEVSAELDREGSVTVDESGPTGASTIEFTGDEGDDPNVPGSGPIGRAVGSTAVVNASVLFGADGAAAANSVVYSLELGGSDTDLTLTDGSAIELQLIDGVIVGVVTEGPFDGQAAFAIAINPATGVATVELYLSLDHPDVNDPNDALPLGPNTVDVVVTATDGDGDSVESDPVDISGLFEFRDDGPSAGGEANPNGAVTVDESGPTGASTIEFTGDEGDDGDVAGSGPIGRAVGVAAVVDGSAVFGADGPGGDDLSYSLQLGSADTDLTLTDGSAIELQLIDGVIVGVVTEGPHDGEAAFAIAINPATGVATVELYLSLDHPINPNPNDSLPLGPNTVSVVVTATDGDGDSVDSDPVDISGLFNFLDDGPSVDGELNGQGAVVVDESGPTGASTIEFTGDEGNDPDVPGSGPIGRAVGGASLVNATALFGADGPDGDGLSYALQLGSSDTALTLTDGSAIELQLIDGVIVGVVTEGPFDGQAAFAIAIDPNTGIATVELYLSLDHPNMSNPNDSLPLGPNTVSVVVTATDGDGDTATSDPIDVSGQFSFLDDGPNAVVDGEASLDTLVLDETRPLGTETDGDSNPAGLATTTANFADNFETPVDYGADGAGSVSYQLVLNGSNVNSGLFAVDPSDTSAGDGDGIGRGAQIVLNQSGNTITGSAGGVDYFTISINPATGVVTFTQLVNVWHANTGSDDDTSTLTALANSLLVQQTVTDGDGDTDTASVDVSAGVFQVEDDGPVAVGDVDTVGGEGENTTGNVLANDDVGADAPGRVSNVVSVNEPGNPDTDPSANFSIQGEFGVLVMNANGSYTYTRDAGTPGGAVDTFTYTLIDADGDTTTATLAITLGDASPEAGNVTVQLDDETLPGGIAGGTGDVNPDTANLSGDLPGSGGDGTLTFGVLLTGEPAGFDYVSGGAGVVLIQQGGETKVTVTVNPDGSYTVVQNNPIDHAPGGAENDVQFIVNYTVTDEDGDPAVPNGTITINVDDDTPNATVNGQAPLDTLVLDETRPVGTEEDGDSSPAGLATTTANFADNFTAPIAYGADGPGSVSYGLVLSGANVASGLYAVDPADTSAGDGDGIGRGAQILLNQAGNTITGSAGGVDYFTISIDPATGVVTFTQLVNVWHGNIGSDDDTSTLTALANSLRVSQTVTDNDGDTAQAFVDVSAGVFQIEDDGPNSTVNTGAQLDTLTLDETRPVGQETDGDSAPAGLATVNANFADNFTAVVDYGADGAGSVSYSLFLNGSNVNSGLYALDAADISAGDGDGIGRGAQIVLNQSGNTITGSVGGVDYFTISINPATGVVTFTQLANIWHSSTASDDDTSTLTALANSLQVRQTVTDADGDSDTSSIDVSAGVFNIEDDGPKFTSAPAAVEAINGNTAPVIGNLNLNIGTDGYGLLMFNQAHDGDAAVDGDGNPLSMGGEALFYQVNGNVLTAETADGDIGFTITLNQNGTYTFDVNGTISNGTETSFTNLTSSAAGNVDFRLIGQDTAVNNAPNTDIILSGRGTDGTPGTINTDSDSIGVDSQAVNPGAAVRIDLVQNLETIVGPGDPPNGPQGFHHSGHVETQHFEQFIPQVQGSQTETVTIVVHAILADDDNEYDNTPSTLEAGETRATVHTVTVNSWDGGTVVFEIGDGPIGTPQVGGEGITVTFLANGSVQIAGLQQGDQYEIDTSTDFNAIIVESPVTNSNDFDLGIFTIGSTSAGTPIVQEFDIIAQDRDGDQEASTITTTINPVAPLTLLAAQSNETERSMSLNTGVTAGAVAAAGLMSMEAAAAPPSDDQSSSLSVDDSSPMQGNLVVEKLSVDDAADDSSQLSSLVEDSSEDSGPGQSNGHANSHSEAANDAGLDTAASHTEASDNHADAADQGPANAAPAAAAAPVVAMPSADALAAVASADGPKHGGSVEKIVADALGHGDAPTVDGLLGNLPGGNDGLAALAHVASPAAGHVPGWDIGGHGGFASGADMMITVHAQMQHHDAVQPVANG